MDEKIQHMRKQFDEHYVKGIARMIRNDIPFLSFHCTFAAMEAIARWRYPKSTNLGAGQRFKEFVSQYMPEEYSEFRDQLWAARNRLIHSFALGGEFHLTHDHRLHHFGETTGGSLVLNADDFHGDVIKAARNFFDDVKNDSAIEKLMLETLNDTDEGGGVGVVTASIE